MYSLFQKIQGVCFRFALKEGKFPEKQNEVIIPDYLNANLEEGNQILIGDTLPLELGEREYKGERLSQSNSYMGTETKAEESFVPKENGSLR